MKAGGGAARRVRGKEYGRGLRGVEVVPMVGTRKLEMISTSWIYCSYFVAIRRSFK